MKHIFYCILFFIFISCSSTKIGDCKIQKVLNFEDINEDTYYMKIQFKDCNSSKEDRISLVKKEFLSHVTICDGIASITEFPGKIYNTYVYDIKLE